MTRTVIHILGTGAASIRALGAARNEITDPVAALPSIEGLRGKAWTCDLAAGRERLGIDAENDATLVHWVIEAPFAHPAWHSYSLVLIHLRPMPDARPARIHLAGATHELWLNALDPRVDRRPLIASGIVAKHWLAPANFAAQIVAESDEAACVRVAAAVRLICEGRLDPDTDACAVWQRMFGDNMVRAASRAPPAG